MTVHPGRFSAAVEGDFVVFLTGTRTSKPMKIRPDGCAPAPKVTWSAPGPRRAATCSSPGTPTCSRQDKRSSGDDPASAAFRTLVKAAGACIHAGVSASSDAFGGAVCVWVALHGYASLTTFPWPDGNLVLDHLITGLARPATAGPPAAVGGPPADPHNSDEGCMS